MDTLPTVTFQRATAHDVASVVRLWPHDPHADAHRRLNERARWVALAYCDRALAAGGELARCGRRVEIANVVVLPEWRRRGVGRALVTHLCDMARRQRIHTVQLTVDSANVPAVRLYAACGFNTVGTLALTPEHSLLIMEKRL